MNAALTHPSPRPEPPDLPLFNRHHREFATGVNVRLGQVEKSVFDPVGFA
jgi:hypothetical protein